MPRLALPLSEAVTRRASGPNSRISFQVDARDVAKVQKRLDSLQGLSLYQKMRRSTKVAGELVSKRIQQAAPRRTGTLRRSVWARYAKQDQVSATVTRALTGRSRGGQTSTVLVGPVAGRKRKGYHRHLIIRGHRIVTPGGRFTGRRTTPNPFVDRASQGFERQAAKLVKDEWMRRGGL
jgi:hypothetical protein